MKFYQSRNFCKILPLLVVSIATLWLGRMTLAQDTPTPNRAAMVVAEPKVAEAEELLSDAAAEELVRQLSAPTFAEREKATGEILRQGMSMVPHLRRAVEAGGDAELMLRASTTLGQLTSGNFESRVAAFLSGRDVGQTFDGWLTVSAILGDTPPIRQLFIEIVRAHPDVVSSLDRTTRDRTVAVDLAAQTIQTNMFERHIFPTIADGVAILLPLVDPAVTISGGYEATLVSVMQKHAAALRQDSLLWPKVSALLNEWVLRSRIENRTDVLWYSMQWDLSAGGQLGVRTLTQTNEIESLQTAMQAIARFGVKDDAKLLVKFISDPRPAVCRMPVMVNDETLEVMLGDVAMATIALLYKVPLSELGMTQGEQHPGVGFLVDSAGYPPRNRDARAAAIKMIQAIIDGTTAS